VVADIQGLTVFSVPSQPRICAKEIKKNQRGSTPGGETKQVVNGSETYAQN